MVIFKDDRVRKKRDKLSECQIIYCKKKFYTL